MIKDGRVQEERFDDNELKSLTPKVEGGTVCERREENVPHVFAFNEFIEFIDNQEVNDIIPRYSCTYPTSMITWVRTFLYL